MGRLFIKKNKQNIGAIFIKADIAILLLIENVYVIGVSSNGRTRVFEALYEGSIPSAPTSYSGLAQWQCRGL
jgi:hypothetical protein